MSDGRAATARSELQGALAALDDLAALVAEGEHAYATSVDRRARVRYLWIVVGSRLKNYCQVMAIPRAAGSFGQAIGLRHTLAYARPDRVDDSIVWRTSVHDLPALRDDVSETVDALGE
ncbi:MAG: ribonuclease HepT family protein [Acidimicrobiales bacterium]